MTRATTAASPREALLAFPRNTRFYAEQWLISGQAHQSEHWLIGEKLAGWRKAVELAGLREEMAAKLAEETRALAAPRVPRKPAHRWIMSSGRVTGLGDEQAVEVVEESDAPVPRQTAPERTAQSTAEAAEGSDSPTPRKSLPPSANSVLRTLETIRARSPAFLRLFA